MTARALFHQCRKAGITLAANGAGIVFDAPAGAEVPVEPLRQIKPELLAVLNGDYLSASFDLVMSLTDPGLREDLAYRFDERSGICQYDGNASRGDAERQAYVELARAVEADTPSAGAGCRR